MNRLRALLTASAALALAGAPAPAQDGEPPPAEEQPVRKPYTGTLRQLVGRHDHVKLTSIGKSRGRRPLELLTILPVADGETPPLEETTWGALLVARLSGLRDQDESRLALDVASWLAEKADAFPPGAAFHVLVDANPDATAAARDGTRRAGNDHPVDEDLDGDTDEDGPDDLDGDGRISWMRYPDPSGELSDPLGRYDVPPGPRAPELADPEKGKPRTHRVVREGRDGDDDGKWNEDGPGGVDLSRNFTWEFEEHTRVAGAWPISEPESRALMDFLLADERIAVVYELGDAEIVAKAPKPTAAWPKLPEEDRKLYEGLRELHGKGAATQRREAAPGPGSLGGTAVHQLGRIWVGRAPLGRSGPAWPAPGSTWPSHLVMKWRPVSGTSVPKDAELGDPVAAEGKAPPAVSTETESVGAFLLACARERARIAFVDTELHRIEGVLGIRTRLVNQGRLPTHMKRGAEVKGRRPINVRVKLPPDAHVLAGKPLVQVERLGPGERSDELKFVIRGTSGAKVVLEATGPDVETIRLEHEIP
jgi:hypothetical protein